MFDLTNPVLYFLLACCVAALAGPLFKDRIVRALALDGARSGLKPLLIILVPFCLLLAAGLPFSLTTPELLLHFAGALVVMFLLCQLGFPPFVRAVLLLASAVAYTQWVPSVATPEVAAVVLALSTWKFAANLLTGDKTILSDVLPAFCWLAGGYWLSASGVYQSAGNAAPVALGAIATAVLVRAVQGPFLSNDKLFLKRICLAIFGLAVFLGYMLKIVIVPAYQHLAVLFGLGLLLAYIFDAIEAGEDKTVQLPEAIKALVLIGIFTLMASRLFEGTLGWLILAPAMFVARNSGLAVTAGMFFVARVFLQGFIASYNSNVTGINVMHQYTSAALYGGLLFVLVVSAMFRDIQNRRFVLTLVLGLGTIGPWLANYFLHAEPASSLLLAVVIGSVILAVMAPVVYQRQLPDQQNLMLLPVHMLAAGVVGGTLIARGTEATNEDRMLVLAVVAVLAAVALAVSWWLTSRPPAHNLAEAKGE